MKRNTGPKKKIKVFDRKRKEKKAKKQSDFIAIKP